MFVINKYNRKIDIALDQFFHISDVFGFNNLYITYNGRKIKYKSPRICHITFIKNFQKYTVCSHIPSVGSGIPTNVAGSFCNKLTVFCKELSAEKILRAN